MTDDQISEIVCELLNHRFADIGFERSTVKSEEDFDGSSILRVIAHFKNGNLPANRLIDARHEIRSELIQRGDDRFVFLDTEYPHVELIDEDLE
jgi:hypothetical protein